MTDYKYIEVEIIDSSIVLIRLNRPKAMNALCDGLMNELATTLAKFDKENNIACQIITGNDRAFAAGMDIKEMQARTFSDTYYMDMLTENSNLIANCRKPIIAAVAGYALGGGCELAMMCDILIAADNAKFGQPEVTIGTLPGFGGSQRLTRLIGRQKAMDMCLTGRMIDASEAVANGLAARKLPLDNLIDEAISIAKDIANKSQMATMMIKEAINRADESFLTEGIRFERRLFHASFSTFDQKEGMQAFIDKREVKFSNK